MKFKEFCVEIKRTLPNLDKQFQTVIEGSRNTLLPHNILDRIHMNLGFSSETHELMDAIAKKDTVNIGEELTDKLWYIGNDAFIMSHLKKITNEEYLKITNYDFRSSRQATDGGTRIPTTGDVMTDFMCMVYLESKLQEYTKKELCYNKPTVISEYCKQINYLLGAINNIAFDLDINLEDTMDRNIAKLKARFPDKFSIEKANNRDLAKERQILEAPKMEKEFSAMQGGNEGG